MDVFSYRRERKNMINLKDVKILEKLVTGREGISVKIEAAKTALEKTEADAKIAIEKAKEKVKNLVSQEAELKVKIKNIWKGDKVKKTPKVATAKDATSKIEKEKNRATGAVVPPPTATPATKRVKVSSSSLAATATATGGDDENIVSGKA